LNFVAKVGYRSDAVASPAPSSSRPTTATGRATSRSASTATGLAKSVDAGQAKGDSKNCGKKLVGSHKNGSSNAFIPLSFANEGDGRVSGRNIRAAFHLTWRIL
jgi:hypothetical protein